MKRALLFFAAILSSAAFVSARIPVEGKIRLSEGWSFLRQDLGNIWEAVRPVRAGQPETVPLWENVTLPHCFNASDCVDPDINYYQGPGWYRTLIDIANPYAGGRTLLEFEGAGQKTDVYVHTSKVASHTGGYDSWNVDITDAVRKFLDSDEAKRFGGKIPVSIRCDNSRDTEMIPSDLSDFNIYGGIYRHLNLIYLPPVTADALWIYPRLSADRRTGKVRVEASFHNPSDIRSADVTAVIKSPDGKILAEIKKDSVTPLGKLVVLETEIKNPELWDVDSPRRYLCQVTVKAAGSAMTSRESFGFRDYKFVDKGPFLLNGRRLLLRGTHRHEDHAGVGAAMTDSMTRLELKMMKDMGVNFIRLGHYQQSDLVLDLCDSLGIIVWEEIPWCRGGIGGDNYRRQARGMLANMVNQHFNHPSVIIWGLGNENDWPNDFPEFEQREIRAFMSELNDLAHSLDPSRKTAIRRCDFCSDIVDVYSPSIWAGWYRGDFTQYHDFSLEAFNRVKHFLHVEWGGDSHPGRFSENGVPSKKDWSETYLARLIDWHLKEQETMPWLTGTAYWPFKDFSTPVRPENPVPYVNQKGVVERDLKKKEAYYIFQSYWTDKPMVHIFGHSQPVRWGDVNEKKEVLVYSNCDRAELFINGKSLGTKKRDITDYPAAGLHWNAILDPGTNDVRVVAKGKDGKVCSDSLIWEYQTAKWGRESYLNVSRVPIDEDTERIEVTVVDDHGVTCLDSRSFIRFDIAGDGTLLKNLGTSGGSSKVEAANGRASITIRKNDGRSAVSVSSQSLPTRIIMIE